MASAVEQEFFNQGVCTKRHPTLLTPGELQRADHCVYRSFDPAIHSAPGRTLFNSVALAGAPVKGLAYLPFDLDPDLLLGFSAATLAVAPFTALTGTFTNLQGVGTLNDVGTEIMNVVPFGNRFYILTSGTTPRRVGYVRPPLLTVAGCTSAGTTLTTTTANGFNGVIVGQGVSGTGITAGSVVTAKASSTSITLSLSGTASGATVTFSSTSFVQAQIAGLKPVNVPPTVVTASGSWNSSADMGVGTYWFIYTEMFKPGQIDDFDSGFLESGIDPTTPGDTMRVGSISSTTTDAIRVTRGSVVNTEANASNAATHWQVYMSDRGTDTVTKPSLATFKRIGQPIDISLTTFLFTDTQLTQGPSGPTANTTLSGVTTLVTPSGAHVAHDGSSAGNASTTTDLGNKFTTFGFVSSGAVNGGTLTGSETVTGIEVLTYGRDTDASVILTSTTNTRRSTPQFPTMKNWSTIQTGGPMDTWGQVWLPADFTNASGFGLEYRARARGGQQPSLTDGITVKIYYTGTSVNRNGVPFRTVTYRSQVGTSVTDSAIQYPPPATTGDVFQGSLVLNSANDPAKLIYSLPDNPDAFPKPYFLRFNLPAKDIVTNIKRLGQILIVGLRDCIQRVNYLPTELDTQITGGGGSAHEDLATDHGIVGPRAACLFDFPGAGPVLAYVSYKGLHITDGVTTKFLNVDLDWVNTVNLDNISTCVLVNYPQEEWLVFFYNPVGASHTQNTRAFVIPYAIDKTKENGTLPVVGPLTVSGRSSCSASISGRTYLLTGHQTLGKVYVEDQGITIAAGYTVADSSGSQVTVTAVPLIKTRRIYPSGLGRQARDQRVYVMTDALGAAITVVSSTTSASATVTSAALFGSVTTGMLVTGDGIQPDTIVTAVGSTSSITLSKAATATGVGVTLTFSTGTLSLTVAGQDTNAALATLETQQQDTRVGGLVVYHADNLKESVEYTFTKATDGSSSFAVAAALRLHYFARMSGAAGQETHRA